MEYWDGHIPDDPGEIIDGEIVSEEPKTARQPLKAGRQTPQDRQPKSGVPDVEEWMHFFGKVLIRGATDFYIDMAFRDVDENALTDREIERIKLSDVERDRMARPLAEFSTKSKIMRKHGRKVISAAGSVDALIQLGMWFSRVNRIAANVKRRTGMTQPRQQPVRAAQVFRPTPRQQPPAPEPETTEGNQNGSARESTSFVRGDHWRPDIAGQVFNTTGGG